MKQHSYAYTVDGTFVPCDNPIPTQVDDHDENGRFIDYYEFMRSRGWVSVKAYTGLLTVPMEVWIAPGDDDVYVIEVDPFALHESSGRPFTVVVCHGMPALLAFAVWTAPLFRGGVAYMPAPDGLTTGAGRPVCLAASTDRLDIEPVVLNEDGQMINRGIAKWQRGR